MDSHQLLEPVSQVICEVLGQKNQPITAATTARDVPRWDSLSNMEIVLAIEKTFRVRFTTREIQSFQNVGQMCDTIAKKQASV